VQAAPHQNPQLTTSPLFLHRRQSWLPTFLTPRRPSSSSPTLTAPSPPGSAHLSPTVPLPLAEQQLTHIRRAGLERHGHRRGPSSTSGLPLDEPALTLCLLRTARLRYRPPPRAQRRDPQRPEELPVRPSLSSNTPSPLERQQADPGSPPAPAAMRSPRCSRACTRPGTSSTPSRTTSSSVRPCPLVLRRRAGDLAARERAWPGRSSDVHLAPQTSRSTRASRPASTGARRTTSRSSSSRRA